MSAITLIKQQRSHLNTQVALLCDERVGDERVGDERVDGLGFRAD